MKRRLRSWRDQPIKDYPAESAVWDRRPRHLRDPDMIDLVTMGDVIQVGGLIHGRCETCGRTKTFDPAKTTMAADTRLTDAQRAMRCAECKEKTIILRVIQRPPTQDEIMAHPAVRAILDTFPGSTVTMKNKEPIDEH